VKKAQGVLYYKPLANVNEFFKKVLNKYFQPTFKKHKGAGSQVPAPFLHTSSTAIAVCTSAVCALLPPEKVF
jgi:hypothetical protein